MYQTKIKPFFIFIESRWIYHQTYLHVNAKYTGSLFYLFHSDDHFLVYIRLYIYIYLRDMQHKELLNTGDCTYKVDLEVHLLLNNEFIDPLHSRTEQSLLLKFLKYGKKQDITFIFAWCVYQKHWKVSRNRNDHWSIHYEIDAIIIC